MPAKRVSVRLTYTATRAELPAKPWPGQVRQASAILRLLHFAARERTIGPQKASERPGDGRQQHRARLDAEELAEECKQEEGGLGVGVRQEDGAG